MLFTEVSSKGLFLTYTRSMSMHFGTDTIKSWIDGNEWKDNFPGFYDLEIDEKKNIEHALLESASGPLLRIWEEVFLLFIKDLRKSSSSTFKKLNSIFQERNINHNK